MKNFVMETVPYLIAILGGIAMSVDVLFRDGRHKEHWMRKASLLSGLFAVVWGVTALLQGALASDLPNWAIILLNSTKSLSGGGTLGLILYMMLFKSFWRAKPPSAASEPNHQP